MTTTDAPTIMQPAPAPTHRAPYDEVTDRIRRRTSQVPARHSWDPTSTTAAVS